MTIRLWVVSFVLILGVVGTVNISVLAGQKDALILQKRGKKKTKKIKEGHKLKVWIRGADEPIKGKLDIEENGDILVGGQLIKLSSVYLI